MSSIRSRFPAIAAIDAATLAAQSMPRQDGGLGAALFDLSAQVNATLYPVPVHVPSLRDPVTYDFQPDARQLADFAALDKRGAANC